MKLDGELTASCRPSSFPWLLSSPLRLSPLSRWCAARPLLHHGVVAFRLIRPARAAAVRRGSGVAKRDAADNPYKTKRAQPSAAPTYKSHPFVRTVPNKWAERMMFTQDVDYGRDRNCVKHKPTLVVKTRRSKCRGLERLLVGVTFEGEGDEAIDERGIVDAGRRPEFREHADRREARQRVDLVHE